MVRITWWNLGLKGLYSNIYGEGSFQFLWVVSCPLFFFSLNSGVLFALEGHV